MEKKYWRRLRCIWKSNSLLRLGFLLAGLCVITASPLTLAEPLNIPRVTTAPTIDGTIHDKEWAAAATLELNVETNPGENVTPPVKTDVFLMEDGENLFVAFIAHDPDTDAIRAYYRDHDKTGGHDIVGVVLDTFNDERQAFEFFVNPLGVQRDAINDDINHRYNSAWDGLWYSAGHVNGSNYTVEMAIPLSQLRFSSNGDLQTWGIDILRFYPRSKTHRISYIPLDRNINCYLCQLEKAQGFAGVEPGRNLTLIPTLTTNTARNRPDPAVDDWEKEGTDTEAGLDVRWGINQNTYLNATINPDFSQVEADTPQLDVNTTFSLFFPERRTFFLDGADYFNTRLNVVHTRNIADPDYGLKLTGKNGPHTYGLLTARDTVTSFIIPGNLGSRLASLDSSVANTESDIAIARYRYDIGSDFTLGGIITNRSGEDYANSVAGVDGIFKIADSDRIEFQALMSESEYPLDIQTDFSQDDKINDRAYVIQYNHNDRHWNWFGRYDDFGKDFRADLGFINKVDYSKTEIGGGYTWHPEEFAYSRISTGGNWDRSEAQDGLKLEEEIEGFVSIGNGPKQSFIEFGGGKRNRYYSNEYYDEKFGFFVTGFRPVASTFLFFLMEGGDAIDFANVRPGEFRSFRIESSYEIGRHITTALNFTQQRFKVDQGLLFTAKLADFRFTYQFSNNSFLRFTTQLSNTHRNPGLYIDPIDEVRKTLASQLLYSYKINALSRLFLGYSDAGFQNDSLDQIEQTNRTVFMKVSYAWQ